MSNNSKVEDLQSVNVNLHIITESVYHFHHWSANLEVRLDARVFPQKISRQSLGKN